MLKYLITLILIVSSSLYAQSNRPNKKSFDCQMSRYSCRYSADIETVTVRTYNYNMATRQCESLSTRKGMNYCGVLSESRFPGNSNRTNEYRCQLTKSHCGRTGAKYGVWVKSRSESQAQRECRSQARRRGDQFCRISDSRIYSQYNFKRYTCHISLRGCYRTTKKFIQATSFISARAQCTSMARNDGRRLCEVTRR